MNKLLPKTVCAILLMVFVFSCGKKSNFKLEKEGDIECIAELVVPELLNQYAVADDGGYKIVMQKAIEAYENNEMDLSFIDCFATAWQQTEKRPMTAVFNTIALRDSLNATSSDAEVTAVLKRKLSTALDETISTIKKRMKETNFSYSIDRHDTKPLIVVVAHGLTDDTQKARLHKIIQSKGVLEFWETYDASEIISLMGPFVADDSRPEEYVPGVELIKRFNLNSTYDGSCIVGFAKSNDTAFVNSIICTEQMKQKLPKDLRLLWSIKPFSYDTQEGQSELFELHAIRTNGSNKPKLDGSTISEAKVKKGYNGDPVINIQMNEEGTSIWTKMTTQNINHCIAMVFDGQVYTAPRVMTTIEGGRSEISGNFTLEECQDMASILNTKFLPVPVRIIRERSYHP